MPCNIFSCRIYYEDTDAGGIVYYANYLRFAERARTEFLRHLGISQSEWAEKKGVSFVVSQCHCSFKKSARLDDLLVVETTVKKITPVRLFLLQLIKKKPDDILLVALSVELVTIGKNGKATRMDDTLIRGMTSYLEKENRNI